MSAKKALRVAVEGCCHGELDKIYETMKQLERQSGKAIDLLICCGDFQAVRNLSDLECLACPPKYRALNTFWKYYSGRATAPYPTLFIGGNHEAMNYLWELYYGGWVAPNIMYLGHAGVVKFGGIRIGGLSGIFNGSHYKQGHWERPPYDNSSMRSAYHVRELDVYRLLHIHRPLDVFLSHDWPRGIANFGNRAQLFRAKPFLQKEIEDNSLGSPPAERILQELKPAYWFSAHLHVKYAALVPHPQQPSPQQGPPQQPSPQQGPPQQPSPQQGPPQQGPPQQPKQGNKRKSPDSPKAAGKGPEAPPGLWGKDSAAAAGQPGKGKVTRFLALDKCLPRRGFLQVVDFPDADGPLEFSYDEEWLAILQDTHQLMSLTRHQTCLPGMGGKRSAVSNARLDEMRHRLSQQEGQGAVPANFSPTAPAHDPSAPQQRGRMPQQAVRNPQTEHFLSMLGLPYNLDQQSRAAPSQGRSVPLPDPSEIALDETVVANPEEIDLDDADDTSDVAEPSAEAAKQGMAEHSGMFAHEELHNFSNVARPDSAMHASDQGAGGSADQQQGVSPALAAIMQTSDGQQRQ